MLQKVVAVCDFSAATTDLRAMFRWPFASNRSLFRFQTTIRPPATAEHGLRIMAMLYLTPILPLGPVSYMCGTTSMPLSSFVLAKVASLPLMLLYVFIGASTGALISDKKKNKGNEDVAKQIEQNQTLIVSGILLSVVMIVGISYYIKKELYKVRYQNTARDAIEPSCEFRNVVLTNSQHCFSFRLWNAKRN